VSSPHDALELELRQIPGVRMVAFGERNDVLLVQVALGEDADEYELRHRASAIAAAHLEGPHIVEVVGDGGRGGERVRLLAVIVLPDQEVEVHLGKGGRRTIGRRRDPDEIAAAVGGALEALEALGLDVPFAPGWAGSLGEPSGQAIAVSLEPVHGAATGTRWGVAVGPSPTEAAVRATLDALNRHLAATPPRA
jgi:hypothetical protein